MAPAADGEKASPQGHIETEFAHALGNLRAFLDGQLAFQPQPPPQIGVSSMAPAAMLTCQPIVGDQSAFQRAHVQTLRSLEQWSTVLNDYLNLLDGCCASHPMMRQRVAAITRRLHRLQLNGNIPQPTASLYPVQMTGPPILHSHQIKRNLLSTSTFNTKHSPHPASAGHGVSSGCSGARCTDVHATNVSSGRAIGGPPMSKTADRRGQGDM